MRNRVVILLSLAALVLAACGGDDDELAGGETSPPAAQETTPAGEETTAPAGEETPPEAEAATTVTVASSDLGDIVVDGEGRTLYGFVPDGQGAPTCTGDCASTWPPLEGPASAGSGADAALLGTVEHPSGVTQVTYNGWPLYRFANDAQPGDTNGQGVGDNWFVVGPDGELVRDGGMASNISRY